MPSTWVLKTTKSLAHGPYALPWALADLNHRIPGYEPGALTGLS